MSAVATSVVTDWVDVAGVPEPSFALNVTVFEFAVHFAYNVRAEESVTDCELEYATAPLEEVAQPANV